MNIALNPLFSTVLDEWLDQHKLKILASTAYGYAKVLPAIKEYFNGVHIQDIDADMIYNYIQYLLKTYTNQTCVRQYGKVMRLSFKFAQMCGYIIYNHAQDVSLPKRTRAEIFPFTENEMRLILNQDTLPWIRDGIVIAYHTGMRLSEIYALKWADINLDEGFIMVQRTQSRAGSKITLKTTKTKSGVRRIDIDSYLADYLRKMQLLSGNCPFVFTPPPRAKYPFRIPYNISKYLRAMCVSAGIAQRNFHQIRHTHATVLMAHGVHPKVVQERLGHSSIMITLDIYSHVAPTLQQAAVDVFESIS